MTRRLAAAVLLLGFRTYAEEINRAWQIGKLRDGQTKGTYNIEFEKHAYLVRERPKHGRRPANLKVGAPIRFALEKRKLFVVDEDGEAREMQILKETAR